MIVDGIKVAPINSAKRDGYTMAVPFALQLYPVDTASVYGEDAMWGSIVKLRLANNKSDFFVPATQIVFHIPQRFDVQSFKVLRQSAGGHDLLLAHPATPIAVGESIYTPDNKHWGKIVFHEEYCGEVWLVAQQYSEGWSYPVFPVKKPIQRIDPIIEQKSA